MELLLCLGILVVAFFLRIVFVTYKIYTTECSLDMKDVSLKILACIGSGGHTTELLRIMANMDRNKYQPRLYVLADNDVSSEVKIRYLEGDSRDFYIAKIPRSRNVNQPLMSSVFSTINASWESISIVYYFKPNLILSNGPGTCIPVCFVGFILRCLFILDCRIVFIESVCRVRTLSLTGTILQFFADIFVVQWPQLRDACYRAKYFGRLS